MVTHTLAGAVCHSKLKCKQVWVIKKKIPWRKGVLSQNPEHRTTCLGTSQAS